MEAHDVLARLRKSSFIFTEAQRLRDQIKLLDDDQKHLLVSKLRTERGNIDNKELVRALDEIIFNLS